MTHPSAPTGGVTELRMFSVPCRCKEHYHTEQHDYEHGVVHRRDAVVARFPHVEDAEAYVLAVNAHAQLTAENERLRKALEEARTTFETWTGPLREAADYMQSQDVFPGTVHELRLAADFQRKAIATITASLTATDKGEGK